MLARTSSTTHTMATRNKRRMVSLAAAALLGIATLPALAQSGFPNKPIKFVVPYAAGGTTDLVARTVGAHMAQTLGQPIIIENKPGAGGNIGMNAVAKAPADGYTVGMGAISTNALNAHIYKAMPFDPRQDFTAIGMLGSSTIVVEVGPALPHIHTVAQLVEHLKKHPGTPYATAGVGTSMHLAGTLFGTTAKAPLNHIAYKGSAALITDLLGGQVGIAFDNLPASLPHIQAGKLRALAVAGAQRNPALPHVPTLAEAGMPEATVEPWFGVYGPANLPAPIAAQLEAALQKAVNDPAVASKLTEAGFQPQSSTAQALHALSLKEYERLGKVAREEKMAAD